MPAAPTPQTWPCMHLRILLSPQEHQQMTTGPHHALITSSRACRAQPPLAMTLVTTVRLQLPAIRPDHCQTLTSGTSLRMPLAARRWTPPGALMQRQHPQPCRSWPPGCRAPATCSAAVMDPAGTCALPQRKPTAPHKPPRRTIMKQVSAGAVASGNLRMHPQTPASSRTPPGPRAGT